MFRLLIICLLSCCFTPLLTWADSQPSPKPKSTTKAVVVAEKESNSADYRLQQTDVIRMSIYQESDMQTEALIGKSGSVSFPLIGAVRVKGLTVAELEKKLKNLYEKEYLVSAKVGILVVSYAKKWISVSGAVETPGNIPYPEEGTINLPSAIAMAGGVMENGNSTRITVARKKGGSSTYSLAAGAKITLHPGDTVVVPRLPTEKLKRIPTCTVSGEVRNPGNVELIDGKIDIITAIAMAGGYSKIANQKDAILQKKVKGGHRPAKVSLRNITNGKAPMVFLYPGDILIIRESIF